ncbi:hypothetical protein EZV73_12950 [Acidaminobacter sp. JC074]|uniref:hypothetical protein n=1 Tax=Acidaminobacter sp. JC074 TaxID=2530199 RepID=UPI001F0F496E|nr:hypothetical protein [Acidaminobacter sp. JC074]MCH4888493.1 hypothetical protein [Acidaminobacter sp. JC074]
MLDTYVKTLATENDFRGLGLFYKEIGDYLIILKSDLDEVLVEIRTGLRDEIMPAGVGEKLSLIAEDETINDCLIKKASIMLTFGLDGLSSEEVGNYISDIVDVLNEHLIPAYYECELCKETNLDSETNIIKINNRILRAHNTCYEYLLNKVNEKEEMPEGNYVSGIFGGLIFGALGTIPWILAGLFGWIISLLGMVIGLSANYGYNRFGGKQGKSKASILISITVVMVILASFTTSTFRIAEDLSSQGTGNIGLLDSIRVTIYVLLNNSSFGTAFMSNTGLGVVFALMGSWRVIKENSGQAAIRNVQAEILE